MCSVVDASLGEQKYSAKLTYLAKVSVRASLFEIHTLLLETGFQEKVFTFIGLVLWSNAQWVVVTGQVL